MWFESSFEVVWGANRKVLPKEEVESFLSKRVVKNATGSQFVNLSDKATYVDVNHFMLCNLKDAVRIQIYADGSVRMYLYDTFARVSACWDTPEVYTSLFNLYQVDEFISFVEKYKK